MVLQQSTEPHTTLAHERYTDDVRSKKKSFLKSSFGGHGAYSTTAQYVCYWFWHCIPGCFKSRASVCVHTYGSHIVPTDLAALSICLSVKWNATAICKPQAQADLSRLDLVWSVFVGDTRTGTRCGRKLQRTGKACQPSICLRRRCYCRGCCGCAQLPPTIPTSRRIGGPNGW